MDKLLEEIDKLLKELDSERSRYDYLVNRDSKLPAHLVKAGIEKCEKHINILGLKIQLLQLKVAIVSAKESISLLSGEAA